MTLNHEVARIRSFQPVVDTAHLKTPFHSQATPIIRRIVLAAIILLLIPGCEQRPLLERLQSRGTLYIATVTGPLTCYMGEAGAAGLEYDLVNSFAQSLGLKPVFTVYANRYAAVHAVKAGREDMAAGFIPPSSKQKKGVYLSRKWQQATLAFAHTMGKKALAPEKTTDSPPVVAKNSYQAELLARKNIPKKLLGNISEEDILAQVARGRHAYTLSSTAQLSAHANLLPHLVPGASLEEPAGVHWLFGRSFDASLRDAADSFLYLQEQGGKLQQLHDKYISKLPTRDFVTRRDFWKHVQDRLPKYLELFKQAGEETGIDWRLLAAIGYQESHWNAKAVSPTGVRGIMMLTKATAKQQEITNRLDPAQSIIGGARHLLWMEKRIPPRIQGNELLWFTLASYNIGYGHLEDARILTQRQKGDPDKWEDIKQRLPLLAKKEYYKTLKHGRARGSEPVIYVENIRYYYNLLVYWDNKTNGRDCSTPASDYLRLALKN